MKVSVNTVKVFSTKKKDRRRTICKTNFQGTMAQAQSEICLPPTRNERMLFLFISEVTFYIFCFRLFKLAKSE
jgi:hypothetical protein